MVNKWSHKFYFTLFNITICPRLLYKKDCTSFWLFINNMCYVFTVNWGKHNKY